LKSALLSVPTVDLLYGLGTLAARFPDELHIAAIGKRPMPAAADPAAALARAFEAPVGLPPLRVLARDMDMIPFGHLRVYYPVTRKRLNSTRGYERMDCSTYAQKRSFISHRVADPGCLRGNT
jgi:hypothetical protein